MINTASSNDRVGLPNLFVYDILKEKTGGGKMSEIMTYTRKMFDPLRPDVEKIDIADIAHALSMLCRANGHFPSFYSVAQHCINCMMEAKARGYSERLQLACLLHDASEAYLSDITRPVKAELPRYKEIEAPLQEMIWNKWLDTPLTEEERVMVFAIDDAILDYEFEQLMEQRIHDDPPMLFSEPKLCFSSFQFCEKEFLRWFDCLTKGVSEPAFVGIDWMSPCWISVQLCGDEICICELYDISEIDKFYSTADHILIDIPIGLPENATECAARPDCEARNILPTGRKSTIFPVPCRQAVYIDEYAQASAENERILGKKLPSQSHGFSKMIRQVDEFLEANPHCQNRLEESHPEVAFQILNKGKGLQYSKHTEEGIKERIAILRSYDFDPVPLFIGFTPKQYADILDAFCLALSAKIGHESGFRTIPENPACDSRDLKMQMVFGNL